MTFAVRWRVRSVPSSCTRFVLHVELLDRLAARDLAVDALVRDDRVAEQVGDGVEVGRVDVFRVAEHQRRYRVVTLPRARAHRATHYLPTS